MYRVAFPPQTAKTRRLGNIPNDGSTGLGRPVSFDTSVPFARKLKFCCLCLPHIELADDAFFFRPITLFVRRLKPPNFPPLIITRGRGDASRGKDETVAQ